MGESTVNNLRKRSLGLWLLGLFSGLLLIPLILFFIVYTGFYTREIQRTLDSQRRYGAQVFIGYLEDTQLSLMVAHRIIERGLPKQSAYVQVSSWINQQNFLSVDQIFGLNSNGLVLFTVPAAKEPVIHTETLTIEMAAMGSRPRDVLLEDGQNLWMLRLLPEISGELSLVLVKRVPLEHWRFIQDAFSINYVVFNREKGRVVLSNLPEVYVRREELAQVGSPATSTQEVFSLEAFGGPALLVKTSLAAEGMPWANRQIEVVAVLFFLFYLVMLGIVYWMLQSRLIGRITALSSAAQGFNTVLETGSYSPLEPGIHDEVGRLVTVFNTMALSLSGYTKNLQEVVAERTLELEQAQQAQRIFFASMSHELRNPLHTIIGFSDLLQEDSRGMQQEYVRIIHEQSRQLEALLEQIMDVARLESGVDRIRHGWFNIREVLHQVSLEWTTTMALQDCALELELTSEVPEQVGGDEVRLTFLLMNILLALRDSFRLHRMSLTVYCAEDLGQFRVLVFEAAGKASVPGGGDHEPPEHIRKAQGISSPGDKSWGEPIRLALARRLVEIKGGRLRVDTSRNGVCITCAVPLLVEEDPGRGVEPETLRHCLVLCPAPQDFDVVTRCLDTFHLAVENFVDGTDFLANLKFNYELDPSIVVVIGQCRKVSHQQLLFAIRKRFGLDIPIILVPDEENSLRTEDDPKITVIPRKYMEDELEAALARSLGP